MALFHNMKHSSHYLKHVIIHFYPDYWCVFLGLLVLYGVYIWNSLYALSSQPQLGNNLNVFFWGEKRSFMVSSDALSTGLYQYFSNCDSQESLEHPIPHIYFFSIFLPPVLHLHSNTLTVVHTREFQIKFHFFKRLQY